MKFIGGLIKFLAVVLMIVFLLALPFALLAQGMGSLLLSPGKLVDLVEDNLIDEEIIARIAQHQYEQATQNSDDQIQTGGESFQRILFDGLGEFEEDEWEELVILLAPSNQISDSLDEFLSGYYRWVGGSLEVPRIAVDLVPWKSSLKTNLVPAIELVMHQLPACTPDEQLRFLAEGSLAQDAPSCRPGEPVYGLFIEQANTTFPALIDDFPDEYIFTETLQEQESVNWRNLRENISRLAFFSQSSWIFVLGLYVVAIPMGARSLSGVFSWAGWPVFFTGILTVLLAGFLILVSNGGFSNLNPIGIAIREAPAVFAAPLKGMVSDGLRHLARPLLIEGAAMIFIGGVGIVVGIAVAARMRKGHSPEVPVSREAGLPEVSADAPEDTLQLSEEELDQPPEDGEDKPSGMFG